MSSGISRRHLLVAPVAAGVLLISDRVAGQDGAVATGRLEDRIPGEFPRQSAELVREVVGAAHRDLSKVKSIVEQRPSIVNAAWDWGFGDWETALGAAAHTGRRSIAEYLLSRGARMDIFAATMLGQLDVVKAMVAASPGIQRVRGPHGIPLLAHASAGGDEAKPVADYLESLGDAGEAATPAKASKELRERFFGEYAYGERSDRTFTIGADKNDVLEFKSSDGAARRLFVVGEAEFHPAGAPAVRIRLEGDRRESARVVIVDGELTVNGVRAAEKR